MVWVLFHPAQTDRPMTLQCERASTTERPRGGLPRGRRALAANLAERLPAYLVTNVHRRSRARGRRDGAEMDHDVCAPYAIAPYPIGDAREERGAFLIFSGPDCPELPSTLEHTATVLRWKWTNLPRCRFAICGRLPPGHAVALRVPFTFVTSSGWDAMDVGGLELSPRVASWPMRGRESWGASLVGSVYAMPHVRTSPQPRDSPP